MNDLKPTRRMPDEAVLGFFSTLSNWGRWGKDDELGTLNLIDLGKVIEAANLVQLGRTVPCGRLIEFAPKPPHHEALVPPIHFMQKSGESARTDGSDFTADWVGLPLHGEYITHLDAHAHVTWRGELYNGRPARLVRSDIGARVAAIDAARRGIVTRGMLLDIPRARRVDFVDGDVVTADDLLAAERGANATVRSGDAVFVRTGYGAHRGAASADPATTMPGLNDDCLPWLHERSVAALGTDTATDSHTIPYGAVRAPIHTVGVVAMGLWIIDACDLEELARTCDEVGRWEFMVVVAPLRLKNSTGSPVNPLAIF